MDGLEEDPLSYDEVSEDSEVFVMAVLLALGEGVGKEEE